MSAHKKQVGIFDDVCSRYHGGNEQSTEAHESVKAIKAEQRGKVFTLICQTPGGLTCDEIEQRLNMPHQAASARCSELLALEYVCRNGRRKTRSGRFAAVLVRAG